VLRRVAAPLSLRRIAPPQPGASPCKSCNLLILLQTSLLQLHQRLSISYAGFGAYRRQSAEPLGLRCWLLCHVPPTRTRLHGLALVMRSGYVREKIEAPCESGAFRFVESSGVHFTTRNFVVSVSVASGKSVCSVDFLRPGRPGRRSSPKSPAFR